MCRGFPLPPAILTPSFAYVIFLIEPYGGWPDGNCTLSCINHISALFLSKSGMCLFPDNAALSSAENSLEKFSLMLIISAAKSFPNVKEDWAKGLRAFACSRKSLCFLLCLAPLSLHCVKRSVLFSVQDDPSGYICLTIPLRPAYSIHRRRICVDIALVLYLSHALRRAFGKGSSPGRRFGRFREGGSTRYVGYASFFLTTTLHQTYNIYESESVVTLRTVVGCVYVGSGFCFKKKHPMRHRRKFCLWV